MTLTEDQIKCDLWVWDNLEHVRDWIESGREALTTPSDVPTIYSYQEFRESYARIMAKRKCACAYQRTKEQAEILSDVERLVVRCNAAEGHARAAETLLSEAMDREHKEAATTAWLIIGAYAAGALTLAGIAHWCGWRL